MVWLAYTARHWGSRCVLLWGHTERIDKVSGSGGSVGHAGSVGSVGVAGGSVIWFIAEMKDDRAEHKVEPDDQHFVLGAQLAGAALGYYVVR